MTPRLDIPLPEHLADELFDRLLEDAEQCVNDAALQASELCVGLFDASDPEVQALRDSLAELGRHHPGMAEHLGLLCERSRELGSAEAGREMSLNPHLVQALRISLEIQARTSFSPADLEQVLRARGEEGDLAALSRDLWAANRRVLTALRSTLN